MLFKHLVTCLKCNLMFNRHLRWINYFFLVHLSALLATLQIFTLICSWAVVQIVYARILIAEVRFATGGRCRCLFQMGQINLCVFISLVTVSCLNLSHAASQCQLAKNCQECMGRGPICSWCFDATYDDTAEGPGYRCSDYDVLIERGCPADKIESRNSTIIDCTPSAL